MCLFAEMCPVISVKALIKCICVSMRKVVAMVGRGEIWLSFGLNHHILGDQAKCQMLFVQLVKGLREKERERGRGGALQNDSYIKTQGREYTDTTCHDEGQMGGSSNVIHHVKYSDWEGVKKGRKPV